MCIVDCLLSTKDVQISFSGPSSGSKCTAPSIPSLIMPTNNLPIVLQWVDLMYINPFLFPT